jgi:hypothetical protein
MNYTGVSVGSDGRSPEMVICCRKIVTMVGRKHNMIIDIATGGDLIANVNSTDVTAKIPTAGMACKIVKMTAPSCWRVLLVRYTCKDEDDMNSSCERHPQ